MAAEAIRSFRGIVRLLQVIKNFQTRQSGTQRCDPIAHPSFEPARISTYLGCQDFRNFSTRRFVDYFRCSETTPLLKSLLKPCVNRAPAFRMETEEMA